MKADPKIAYYVHDGREILRTGHCPRSMLRLQARKGQLAVEGVADDRTEKIAAGVKVRKTRAELDAQRQPPVTPAPGEDIIAVKRKEWDALLQRVAALENAT